MKRPMLKQFQQVTEYHSDPTSVFYHLCQKKPASLLLESAEIDNKQGIKSLMIIDSALRITAQGRTVKIEALTDNGLSLLPLLKAQQSALVTTQLTDNHLILTYPPIDALLDEDSKIKAPSVFDTLRDLLKLVDLPADADQHSLLVGGLFSYDLATEFEAIATLPEYQHCPDYCFYLSETLFTLNHKTKTAKLSACLFTPNDNEEQRLKARLLDITTQLTCSTVSIPKQTLPSPELTGSVSDEQFKTTVKKMQDAITQGEIFQVVPSRRFFVPCPEPLAAYQTLKQQNPSPYMFYMQDEHFTLFGASPESALKYTKETNQVEIYPIAGTRPRGRNPQQKIDPDLDSRLELEMRTDKKELAEHLMLVDLARNDLARICQPGTRYTPELLKVDRYSHVMHLVSRVVGQLRQDLDALHAYQATMNMGTLTGAPKVRAMQLIAETEQTRRGSYGGAIGYFTAKGDFDTCIVIRSAFVANDIATIQAGAGVVFDSDPQAESDETYYKAKAVINAIQTAHQEAR
ncbi:anthranilate synthase component 1 [Zophobihabitans entericus]|uniref:Anthranilate synthase component 1 n=1 Tax=Zophobihabitans entericus TaxID=1635327 RepID=A0A6G9I7S8_9GAMM|nr:anthranilate synthase component 1 [Zophobihabitans entericus]QIQ20261.1 anthranilate synthase component 1 [Zophobihabitans entericus]